MSESRYKAGRPKNFIDRKGESHGQWKIGDYIGKGKYECLCSCGSTYDVNYQNIKNGGSVCCVKCAIDATKVPKINLCGKKFGNYKVIKHISKRNWECKCDCGATNIVPSQNLRHAKLKKLKKCKHCLGGPKDDLSGTKINNWTVVSYVGDGKWNVVCSCNTPRVATISAIKRAQYCRECRKKRVDVYGVMLTIDEISKLKNVSFSSVSARILRGNSKVI